MAKRFDTGLPQHMVPKATMPAFRDATKRSPDNTANGLLPIAHALGGGFVVFCAVGLIAIGTGWPVNVPLIASGVSMLIILCGSGYWMVKEQVLWGIEHIVGDLNKDGMIGQPIQATHYEFPHNGRPNWLRVGQVNLPPQLLIEWCQAAIEQRSLAYDAWVKKFSLADGTQGRERYNAFRSWLISEGFAKEVGGNVGLKILWYNQDAVTWISGFANVRVEDGTPLLEDDSSRIATPHALTHTDIQPGEWGNEG